MAESIVEQAVGALLPVSQTTPASLSLAPTKGFAGSGSKCLTSTSSVEGAPPGMDSTASTAMGVTVTADAKMAGVVPGPGRTAGGAAWPVDPRGISGRVYGPSRRFSRDPTGFETGAGEVAAMENRSLNGDDERHGKGADLSGGGNTGSLALNPPSPSSPRRRHRHDDAATPRHQCQGPAAGGSGTMREQGSGVGQDSDGGYSCRGAGSRAMASEGNGALGNVGGGGDEDGGYVVLLTPTLEQVSLLVAALEAPQVPKMGFVVVCPLYEWNQERDEEELRRLREFTQVGYCTARH